MGTRQRSVPASGDEKPEAVESTLGFEDFFDRYHGRLFAGLCLVTGSRDEAEDLSQEAFLHVWERWDRVSLMDDAAGYLFRTAMNLFRKRRRRAALSARRTLRLAPAADAFDMVDARDALIRAMRELSTRERAAIVLTALEEYSSSEAATLLGVADSTVRVLAARARTQMRSTMGSEER